MAHFGKIYVRRLKRKMYDIRISELDSKKPRINEVKNSKLGDQEVDKDYDWLLLNILIETTELAKVITRDDEIEFAKEDEDEIEFAKEDEDEDDVEKYKDPQYLMFLENLTVSGRSYKLKISQNDEEPRFLCYEEPGDSDWCDDLQNCIDDSGDEVTVSEDMQMNQKPETRRLSENKREISPTKEVSSRKETDNHRSATHTDQGNIDSPPDLNNIGSECGPVIREEPLEPGPASEVGLHITSKYGENKVEENLVEKAMNATTYDSDLVILNNVQNCGELNRKQKKLREKLMRILKQPFNDKEYEELSEYIEQEKPVCRLLPLRGRSISSALGGAKKSLLDHGPGSFRQMYKDVHNDPPKALNLLRMFRFWLEHVPNENVFEPWKDKHIMETQSSDKNAPN